jgi:hypothetical protein
MAWAWCSCGCECECGLVSRKKDGVPSGSLADSEPAACSAGGRRPRGILGDAPMTDVAIDVVEAVVTAVLWYARSFGVYTCRRVVIWVAIWVAGWKRRAVKQKARCECSFPIQTHHSLHFSLTCLHFISQDLSISRPSSTPLAHFSSWPGRAPSMLMKEAIELSALN